MEETIGVPFVALQLIWLVIGFLFGLSVGFHLLRKQAEEQAEFIGRIAKTLAEVSTSIYKNEAHKAFMGKAKEDYGASGPN